MKYNKISEKDRSTIYEAFMNEEDWRSVARALKINTSTAYKWLKSKQEAPKRRGGLYTKKNDTIVAKLIETIERNCLTTLDDLRNVVIAEFGFRVCESTIRNWLDGQLITLKQTRNVIDNMNKEENKVKRSNYSHVNI